MSAELSGSAIYRVTKGLDASYADGSGADPAGDVNRRWSVVHLLYFVIDPAPPMNYLRSAEFALTLQDYDANAIFAHGKPLIFKECPRLLGAKLVE
ncbi:hypothetical protein AAVH_31205, partial [Aphelenchoides avenae]